MELLKDIFDSLRGNLRERVTNPFLATFFTSLVIYNWKILYAFIYITHYKDVHKEINTELPKEIHKDVFQEITSLEDFINKNVTWFVPLLWGLAAPFLLNLSKWLSRILHNLTMDRIYPSIFKYIAGNENVSAETHNSLKNSLKSKVALLDLKDKELESSNKIVNELNSKIKLLEDEKLKITNSRIEEIPLLHLQNEIQNPQGASCKPIEMKDHIIKSIEFDFNIPEFYFRVGIKFGSKNFELFSSKGILSENSYLVHLSKNNNASEIILTQYQFTERIKDDIIIGDKVTYKKINLRVIFLPTQKVEFWVNGKLEIEINGVHRIHREKLYIVAWSDGNEFKLDLENVRIELAE